MNTTEHSESGDGVSGVMTGSNDSAMNDTPDGATQRTEETRPKRAGAVLEILIRRPVSRGALFITISNVAFLVVGFLVLAAAVFTRLGNFWSVVVTMAFFFLVGILTRIVRSRRASRSVGKLIAQNGELLVQRDFGELLSRCAGQARGQTRAYSIQILSGILPRLGAWNFTARIAPQTAQFPISPIVVPFEPVPLDALASWKLDDAPTVQMETNRARSTAAIQGHSGGWLTRVMQSGWAGVAFLALLWSPGLYDALRYGRVDISFVMMSVFLLLALRRALFQRAHASGGQVFVVPSGLVHRTANFKTQNVAIDPELQAFPPDLHVFERPESALVATQMTASEWIVVVADTTEEVKLSMNTLELRRLLAAWLSPLPPPNIRQLSDLA